VQRVAASHPISFIPVHSIPLSVVYKGISIEGGDSCGNLTPIVYERGLTSLKRGLMRFAITTTLFGVLVGICMEAQGQSATELLPLFSHREDGPAFILECTNSSSVAVDAMEEFAHEAIRLDGKLYEHEDVVLGSLMGRTVFDPQSSWRKVFPLSQTNQSKGTTTLGAEFRGGWFMPIAAGRHTLAVRCAGAWSNEVAFYWDDQPAR
jgi:hypothetical protein